MGGPRRRGPRQGAGPLRGVAGRAPRRDRGAADQGDRQVGDRRRSRSAAADHDRFVLHQDHGEGAGAGDTPRIAAVPGDQEGHRALPARAPVVGIIAPWNYPVANAADGRHRRAGRRLRGAAQAVRAHAADRRTVAAWLDRLGCARGDGDRSGRARGRPRPSSTTPTTSSSPDRARRARRSWSAPRAGSPRSAWNSAARIR